MNFGDYAVVIPAYRAAGTLAHALDSVMAQTLPPRQVVVVDDGSPDGEDLARIVAGYRGLPEPDARCERVAASSIDWVLVPGIAFDRSGGRLGYGGGYYDRLLPALPARAARVAGAFSAQIVDAVPSAPHDITMDTVVTEAGVVVDRPRGW